MRKVFYFILCAALLCSLAACRAGNTGGTGGKPGGGDQRGEALSLDDSSAIDNPFAEEQPQNSSLSHGMPVTDPEKKPEIV